MSLSPGDRVDRYVVLELLGAGGMGEVYRARDPKLARPVALKILHTGRGPGTDGAARMLREARAAAALSHANVVAIFDVGEVQEPESLRGLPYIAMELVVGRSLREHVEEGNVPLERRVAWLRQVALALGAAHEAGIVHRDVKPENVMIRADGTVKVLDFGIARKAPSSNEAWASTLGSDPAPGGAGQVASGGSTERGMLVGTPLYMAPEQLRGEDLDGRADQFAWGVMAHVVLVGRLPWKGPTEAIALVSQILSFDPPAPRELEPQIPPLVSEAIVRALSKQREARFGSMEELVGAMDGDRVSTPAGIRRPGTAAASPVATTLAKSQVAVGSRSAITSLRLRKAHWRWVGFGAVACAAVVAGVAGYRAARAPRIHYCLEIAMAADGPRCLSEVGADIVGKRFLVIDRITERGGRVDRVERVSFTGEVDEQWHSDYARLEVVRDDTGAVREVQQYSRFDEELGRQEWSDGGKKIELVDLDGRTPRRGDGDRATTLRLDYDSRGWRTKIRFFGPTGRPRAVRQTPIEIPGGGVYGVALDYGATPGLVVKQTNLGADGAPAPDAEGVVFARRSDALWGDVSVFDVNDRAIAPKGVHTTHTLHDAFEPTGSASFGLRGEPVTDLVRALHEERWTWDPSKRTLGWASFDEQGRPRAVRDGWYVESRTTFGPHARQTLVEFLDAQGNPQTTASWFSAVRFEHDPRGYETVVERLDPTGALTQGNISCARMRRKPNAHEYPTEDRCFDEAGHLAAWTEGGAISRATYDDRDLQLTWSSADAEDHPVATVNGYALVRRRYDRQRNIVETAWFGPDGKPAITNEGIAVRRDTYDDNDDLVLVAYFDANGSPSSFQSEYATKRLKNDERGLVIEESYGDVHGDPVLVKEGYAAVSFTRDRNGDVIDETFRGKNGEPILRDGGFARRHTTYSPTRHPLEVSLLDATGAPVRGTAGWARERTTYDDRGLVVRIDHLDAAGAPVMDKEGSASVARVSDSRGNLVEETSLDVAGRPVLATGGYATKKTSYDDRDEVVEESLLGSDGKPISGKAGWAHRRVHYDDAGNVLEEAFFGAGLEPVVASDLTYASMRQRFDERHRLVETVYLDVRGVPTKGPDGAAIVRYARDAYGRALETSYFDGMGVSAPSKDGRMVVHSRYDDVGRLVGEEFTDASGSPHAATDGCFRHATRYDAQSHPLEESCLDAKGAPTLSADGWAVRRTLHDARGDAVEIVTYAPDGALRADKEGIARKRSLFDERSHRLETRYFDANDHPTHDRSGAYVTRFAYDESGKSTGQTGFDQHDHAVATKPTSAR